MVEYDEQQRREGAMKSFGAIAATTVIIAIPFIGWVLAPLVALWMALGAFKKSSNRLLDISLALGGLIPYYALVLMTMGMMKESWFGAALILVRISAHRGRRFRLIVDGVSA